MRKIVIGAVIVGVALAGVLYYRSSRSGSATRGRCTGHGGGGRRGGGRRRRFRRRRLRGWWWRRLPRWRRRTRSDDRGTRQRQTRVDSRKSRVVGNLIGEATVAVAPRTAGRLQDVSVRLGDRVTRGQRIAKIEDFEIVEQVKQAEAAQEVSAATIRQREADLQLARDQRRALAQSFPATAAPQADTRRQRGALSGRSRADRSGTRAEHAVEGAPRRAAHQPGEHRHHLAGERLRRRSARSIPARSSRSNARSSMSWTSARVRLVVNVVEKDLKELETGDADRVEVDAFPGETFTGRIARVSPVLDPGDAHGADRDRDCQPDLPAEAGHVCARRHHDATRRRRRWSSRPMPSWISAVGAACFSR